MNSTLSCIGIAYDTVAEVTDLIDRIAPSAQVVGQVGRDLIQAWEDPSGARLIFSSRDGEQIDLLPSFAGKTQWNLRDCAMWNALVAHADIYDDGGEQLSACTFAPEQHRWLRYLQPLPRAVATVTVLGLDVEVFQDAEVFGQSRASLLQVDGPADGPRLGASSFLSYGVWGEPSEADAFARLAVRIAEAESRRNQATGHDFTLARGQVLDVDVELCLPSTLPVPEPGEVVAGVGYLVGTVHDVAYGSESVDPSGS